MNGLFRVASRSLLCGLVAVTGIASVAVSQGIQSEVQVAFQTDQVNCDSVRGADHSKENSASKGPEFFARAETSSRLDMGHPGHNPNDSSPEGNTEGSSTYSRTTSKANLLLTQPASLPPHPDAMNSIEEERGPELAPLSPAIDREAADLNSAKTRPDARTSRTDEMAKMSAIDSNIGTSSDQEAAAQSAPAHSTPDDLGGHINSVDSTSLAGPAKASVAASIKTAEAPQHPQPMDHPLAASSTHHEGYRNAAPSHFELTFLERLTQMQRQLDQLAQNQQQERQNARSQFETTAMYQQRQLEEKLTGIEQGLRDLRNSQSLPIQKLPVLEPIPEQSESPVAPNDVLANKDSAGSARHVLPSAPLVQEVKPGPDGQKRFSVNSQGADLRELLDALAQKANFNLVLAINVEGDVELKMHNATADEALDAIKKSTGYVVEKAGEKVYVGPPGTKTYQRQEFLPPIMRN